MAILQDQTVKRCKRGKPFTSCWLKCLIVTKQVKVWPLSNGTISYTFRGCLVFCAFISFVLQRNYEQILVFYFAWLIARIFFFSINNYPYNHFALYNTKRWIWKGSKCAHATGKYALFYESPTLYYSYCCVFFIKISHSATQL